MKNETREAEYNNECGYYIRDSYPKRIVNSIAIMYTFIALPHWDLKKVYIIAIKKLYEEQKS